MRNAPAIDTRCWHEFDEACRWDNVPPSVALHALLELAAKLGINHAVDALKADTEARTSAEAEERYRQARAEGYHAGVFGNEDKG